MIYHRIIALLLLFTIVFSLISCKKGETPDFVGKDDDQSTTGDGTEETKVVFVYSTSAKTLHRETCYHAAIIDELFKKTYDGDPLALMDKGFSFCGLCCPEESALYNTKDDEDNKIFDNGITADNASYVINVNSGKFHELDCRYAEEIQHKLYTTSSAEELMMNGIMPCQSCNP